MTKEGKLGWGIIGTSTSDPLHSRSGRQRRGRRHEQFAFAW